MYSAFAMGFAHIMADDFELDLKHEHLTLFRWGGGTYRRIKLIILIIKIISFWCSPPPSEKRQVRMI